MKNNQNTPHQKQQQPGKDNGGTTALNKQNEKMQGKDEDTDLSAARPGMNNSDQQKQSTGQQGSNQSKGNISVDNEGRIGKAHDQWNNGNNNRNKNDDNASTDKQPKSDKTVTQPEIDAPIYDPEKTEKKIPQMEANKKSK